MMRRPTCAAFVVLMLLASPLLAQQQPLPTVDQLKAQLESNPQEVLRNVARMLALKGAAAQQYDRYELLMLRGEAHLRGKAMPPAAQAFADAARETTDPAKKATARANEILMRRSKIGGYTPKPQRPSAKPASTKPFPPLIPIIKEEDRKLAMEALFADEMAVAEPKLKAADNATALPPIIEAIKVAVDLGAVEQFATGGANQTKQLTANLAKRSHFLIDKALDDMNKRTEHCWQIASQRSYSLDRSRNQYDNAGMVGLTSVQQNELKNVIATTEKIAPVATELAAVTGGAELTADATTAQKLHERAKEVLAYDYPNSGRYNKQPQGGQPQQPPRQQQQPPPRQPANPPPTR
jgi:hypothetical protein